METDSSVRAQSLLGHDDIAGMGGLYLHTIFGFMTGDEKTFRLEQFHANPTFVRFMHAVISLCGPTRLADAAASGTNANKWIYLIDQRTPEGPEGPVPLHDIIGAFEVRDNAVVAESYWANPDHLLFSDRGFFQLPPPFNELIVELLKNNLVPEGVYDDDVMRFWDGTLPTT